MCLAVPGKILDISGDDPLFRSARVSFGGVVKQVSLTCAPEANVGDYVLVHVGVAISVVDKKEAEETYDYLRQMGELEGLEPAAEAPRPTVGAVDPNGPGRLGTSAPTRQPVGPPLAGRPPGPTSNEYRP